ncbi:FxLYD domain-containing protein [Candidatus Omnitrophota bacterium]
MKKILVILLLLILTPCIVYFATSDITHSTVLAEELEELELLRLKEYKKDSFEIAEGRVKNVTDTLLKDIIAVVQWYNEKGKPIASDKAAVEFNPILPGQVSPFKVMTPYNPDMQDYSISFETLKEEAVRHRDMKEVAE